MRLRSFATLVACAALAACEGDTILPAIELPGSWHSNTSLITAVFPEGSRPVMGRVELTLDADGEFRREVRYADPVSGVVFPDAITEGTYTASNGTAQLTITRAYFRLGGAPVTDATVQPVQPSTGTFKYSFEDGRLIFTYFCPPNALALCLNDPFPQYTRVDPNWRGSGSPGW